MPIVTLSKARIERETVRFPLDRREEFVEQSLETLHGRAGCDIVEEIEANRRNRRAMREPRWGLVVGEDFPGPVEPNDSQDLLFDAFRGVREPGIPFTPALAKKNSRSSLLSGNRTEWRCDARLQPSGSVPESASA